MDVMSKGCMLRNEKELAEKNNTIFKPILHSCFKKAIKLSNVFSNFNHDKYESCMETQKTDIKANKNEDYDSPKSNNFFDRDWKARQDTGSVVLTPALTVNGEVL